MAVIEIPTPDNPEYFKIVIRPTTDADKDLPAYDHTMLAAVSTCPTWGVLRYGRSKAMPGNGRAMALEAGSASHEFYAALRLTQIYASHPKHFWHHATRLFGHPVIGAPDENRLERMAVHLGGDVSTAYLNFALEALYTSGFYDDPNDRQRTMTNIEDACIAYYDRFDQLPIWISDENDPTGLIGIEIPLDVVMEYHKRPIPGDKMEHWGEVVKFRHIGRCDGIHINHQGRPVFNENKTGARLNDAWQQSFAISHQITGYITTARTIPGLENLYECIVWGMQIPQPGARAMGEGIVREPVERADYHIRRWAWWVYDQVTNVYWRYKEDVYSAPKFSHSCNRYFRPCSFIPFCYADDDEQRDIVENQMEDNIWSPLETDIEANA